MQSSNRNTSSARRTKPLSAIFLTIMMLAPLAALPADAFPVPHFSPQLLLNPGQANGVNDLTVQVADDGTAWAIWEQDTGGNPDIYARKYTPAAGWSTASPIETSPNYAYGCTVSTASNRAGDIVVTWLEWNGGAYQIMGNYYTAAWGWGNSQAISTNATPYADCANYIASINENGDAFVAYMAHNATNWWVRGMRYTQGVGWRADEQVSPMVNSTAYDMRPAVDPSGAITVVWGENNGSDEWLYASRSTAYGVWSSAVLVFKHFDNGPSNVVYTNYLRMVAPLPGLVVVAWQVYNASVYDIWEVRYQSGAWTTAAIISDTSAGYSDYPNLAHSVNGTTTLSMQQGGRVAVKWFTPGQGWSSTSNVTGFVSPYENSVAVNARGQTLLAWEQWNGAAYRVYASTWSPWSGWSTGTQVDYLMPTGSTPWISAGIDGEGNGMVVWRTQVAGMWQPHASKFYNADPDPLPLTIDYPRNRESVGLPSVTVRGHTAAGAVVTVNGVAATVLSDGSYSVALPLTHGWTRVVVNATGRTGPTNAQAVWVAYTDPTFARANETADAGLTGWTPVRSAAGAAEMSSEYTSYGGSIAETFSVSYGANGDGMMYWIASNGTLPYAFYATPYVNGTGWLAPRLLAASNSAPFNPSVVTDGAGRSMVVWEQSITAGNTIWAARFDRYLGWADNEDLTPAPDVGYFPRAAMGSNGDVFVTYARTNVSGTQFMAKRYAPGAGWQPSVVLGQANLIADQAVAVGGAQGAAAAWVNRTGGFSNITVFRFNPGNGSWGPGSVALVSSTYIYDMKAVVNASGAMTIVYRQPTANTTSYNLTAVQSDASNNWGAPVDIDGPLNASTLNWHYSVSVDPNGNVWVIFLHVVSGVQRPLAVRYTPGAGWGATTFLDSDPAISKGWVTGQVSDDGSVIAAWNENNISARVQAVRYLPGQGWGAPVFLTPANGNNIDAVVAMTAGGRALVVSLFYPNYGCCYSSMSAWRFSPPDLTPPALAITTPTNNSSTGLAWASVRGTSEPGARVWVNGFLAVVAANGTFTVSVPLVNGTNLLAAVAMDGANNTALAWTNVTFVDPVLASLRSLASTDANLTAADAALQLNLDNVDAALLQAIDDLGASTVQQLADLNASLLASLAAQNATLAAQIGGLNATLLAQLAGLNATLMNQLAAQNSSLWAAIQAVTAANTAANHVLSDAFNATADALRVEIAALRANQNTTNGNVTAAVARIAALEARLLALGDDLNLTHDELLALIDGVQADLNGTRADFNAQIDASDANATVERARVNAAFDTLDLRLNGTRNSITQSDANLTAAIQDLDSADASNHQEGAHAAELAQGAQGIGTIGLALAAVGIALAVVAAMLAMRARRPAVDDAPQPSSVDAPISTPARAEEVKVETVPHEAHNGHSMTAAGEAAVAESEDK